MMHPDMIGSVIGDELLHSGKDMYLYMCTSISAQSTRLIYAGKDADRIVSAAFGVTQRMDVRSSRAS